jgi:hypothetical protein
MRKIRKGKEELVPVENWVAFWKAREGTTIQTRWNGADEWRATKIIKVYDNGLIQLGNPDVPPFYSWIDDGGLITDGYVYRASTEAEKEDLLDRPARLHIR